MHNRAKRAFPSIAPKQEKTEANTYNGAQTWAKNQTMNNIDKPQT